MRLSLMVAATAAATGLMAASAPAQTLRVASFTPEGAVGVQEVMIPWMEAVEAELGDRTELIPFWGGSLGPNPFDQFDLVRDGVIDVAWILAGYTPGQFPQLQVTELPFTVASAEEASVVAWRLFDSGLIEGLEDVQVITVWTPDVTNIFLNEPVEGLADLVGKALRTSGATQALFVEAIGAAPQVLGSVEANEGMARGTIDGQLQGWTGMQTFGGFAVAKAAYRVPVGAAPFVLLMNKDTWDGLPADVREVMMKHGGEELARRGGQAYDAATKAIVDARAAEGFEIIVPDAETIAAYQETYAAVADTWIADTANGQAVFDAYMGLIDAYRAEN